MYLKKAIPQNIFKIISISASEMQQKAYVVGGYVIDYLLGKKQFKDIDIVSSGSGISLAKQVAKHMKAHPNKNMTVFKKFGTARIKYRDKTFEFVGAIKESYFYKRRNPCLDTVSLPDDQNLIDFTLNSMAISLNKFDYGRFCDPFGGWEDLKTKKIRTQKDPYTTFSYEPLWMVRAIRFSSQLHFLIEKNAFVAIKKNIERIRLISMERIMSEFKKILISDRPSWGINLLKKAGLLALIFPELTKISGIEEKQGYKHKDNFFHTLEVVDNVSKYSNYIWLIFSALLHDLGKYITKKFIPKLGWTFHAHEFIGSKMIHNLFKRLKLPMGVRVNYVKNIIQYSSRPIYLVSDDATDSALRRLLWYIGKDLEDLIILCKADITTKNIKKQFQYRNNFILVEKKLKNIEEKDRILNWKAVISGYEIMKLFDLQPSPIVGIIKNSIKKAVLEGKLLNDFKSVYCFILKKGKELGLHPKKDLK